MKDEMGGACSINERDEKLTPWRRVLLLKLIVSQLLKKSLAFYATLKFTTVLTRARHWSLS
jgi:hypothetical protein